MILDARKCTRDYYQAEEVSVSVEERSRNSAVSLGLGALSLCSD
jgi:hypothetical protein